MVKQLITKTCAFCGEDFETNNKQQTRCHAEECDRQYRKEQNRKRNTRITMQTVECTPGLEIKDWPWQVGDQIRVRIQVGHRKFNTKTGRITKIFDRYLVVNTGKYNITLLKVDWLTGMAKAGRVG